MTSKNLGELEGKPDYTLIFDDFPNCWGGSVFDLVIKEDWDALAVMARDRITLTDLYAVRLYGCQKYDRENAFLSKNTADHKNFMLKNKKSIYRHLVALDEGEEIDPDSQCKHWGMVWLRANIAREYRVAEKDMALVDALYPKGPS